MTLIMDRQEHIHIISAGEAIHNAFAVTIRDHPDITHAFVFADTELYTNNRSDAEAIRTQKEAARDAVNKVKAHAKALRIPASLVYVNQPADLSARDSVLKIKKEHPDARFSFDLSAGSRDLVMALFAISIWVEGDAYYPFSVRKTEVAAAKIAVPKTPANVVTANPNYTKILQILYRTPGKTEILPRILSRHYIFTQFETFYIPVRKKGVKVEVTRTKTDLYTGKRAIIPLLSQGTFTSLLNTLSGWDMIEEVSGPASNRKEKCYRITPTGEFALLLAEIKPQKP